MPETRKMQRPVSPTATNDAEPWHTRIACTKEDAPLFDYDPHQKGKHDEGVIEAAREICRSCPVIDACILDTLNYEAGKPLLERFEIVGALTPPQRLELDTTVARKPRVQRAPNKPRTHCYSGAHELTADNVGYDVGGKRYCRPCRSARRRANNAAKAKELTA